MPQYSVGLKFLNSRSFISIIYLIHLKNLVHFLSYVLYKYQSPVQISLTFFLYGNLKSLGSHIYNLISSEALTVYFITLKF